eukprot:6491084-Amphidinium_carterae.4
MQLATTIHKELGLVVTEDLYTIDPKKESWQFIKTNITSSGCHFDYVADVTDAAVKRACLTCRRHGQACPVPTSIDFFTAGFPCAPYSIQRVARHKTGRCASIVMRECA